MITWGRLVDGVSLNPVAMFVQAGIVGKFVMVVLAVASVWCWLLIVEGVFSVRRLSRLLAGEADLHAPMFDAIRAEGFGAAERIIADESVGERRQRVFEAMQREARALLTRAEGGLPNLAVISSVAPFIGLFGTVWGIMTSFAGIAAAQDTSLAVVAPGIAEALAATAYGLAAAIPASIGYNRIGAALARVARQLFNIVEAQAVSIAADHPATTTQVGATWR